MANLDQTKQEILVTIHASQSVAEHERLIPANVFKAKFSSLLSALVEADKSVNHKGAHEFVVSHLKIGSAEFGLSERPRPNLDYVPASSTKALFDCTDAIYRSNFEVASKFNGIAEKLHSILKGVEETFDYMEISIPQQAPIALDAVFRNQVERFLSEKYDGKLPSKYFRGEASEAFDCQFMEIDYRGHIPRGILVVTGTKIEVPCVFKSAVPESEIKAHLKQRVWAYGNAIYDGSGQLPVRIEVASMENINQTGTPSRWKGALTPFELSDWGADNESLPKQ